MLKKTTLLPYCIAFIAVGLAACDEPEVIETTPDGVIGRSLIVDFYVGDDQADDAEEAQDADDSVELAIDQDAPQGRAYCDDVTTWSSSWATLETQVITEVNKRRAAGATCGGVSKPPAPALTANTQLRCAARKHSKDMGVKNFFSHTGSNGSTFVQRIQLAGYTNWLAAAENIAAGQTTALAVVNGWMNSTGHCNNIMNPNLKHLGVGYYYAATATYKHYWTQDFGRK
jgi:uncharacterized protein YkwD